LTLVINIFYTYFEKAEFWSFFDIKHTCPLSSRRKREEEAEKRQAEDAMFYQEEASTQQALDSIMDQVARRMASFDRKDKGASKQGKTEISGQSAGVSTAGSSASGVGTVGVNINEVGMPESSTTKLRLTSHEPNAGKGFANGDAGSRPVKLDSSAGVKEDKDNCLQENLVIYDHKQSDHDPSLGKKMVINDLQGKSFSSTVGLPTSQNKNKIIRATPTNLVVQSSKPLSQMTTGTPFDNKMTNQPVNNMSAGQQPLSKATAVKWTSPSMKNQPVNSSTISHPARQVISHQPLGSDNKPMGQNSENGTGIGNLKMSGRGPSIFPGGQNPVTSTGSNLVGSENVGSIAGNVKPERREGEEDYLLKNVANMDNLVSDLNNFLGRNIRG
jgi:hypothetical protein